MTEWYILKDRTPVPVDSLEEWARSFELTDRHVANDEIGDVRVSTVFLGLDHNHFHGPPLLFETMIFGGEHDQWQERCSTWKQAEVQHEQACALVRGIPSH